MASAPKVGAVAAAGATTATSWVGAGTSRYTSADRIDGVSGSASIGVRGGWRPSYEDRPGQGFYFFGQYPPQHEPEQPLFTPLVARFASAFPASETYSEIRASTPVFIADLVRGVGIYELNMKVIAGTLNTQGSVINRYG